MSKTRTFSTPMMQQYAAIKAEYQDCILLFRLGDFYELFLDDAELGAKILGITLTARPRGKDGEVPMAGVPYHSADSYITKLVQTGHKVAICEQVSEPDGKGIVEREVVRIITPGTVIDEASLDHKSHNYLLSISQVKKKVGLAFAELSTGEFFTTELELDDITTRLPAELSRFRPAEIIHSPKLNGLVYSTLQKHSQAKSFPLDEWRTYQKRATRFLKDHFQVKTKKQLIIADQPATFSATASALQYLAHTQKQLAKHIKEIKPFSAADSVTLDPSTILNLELFETIRGQKNQGTLIQVLDQTQTAMGGRLLRHWLHHPLKDKVQIDDRLDAVEILLKNPDFRAKLQENLKQVSDLERLISRLTLNLGTPKDLLRLQSSILKVIEIKTEVSKLKNPLLVQNAAAISTQLIALSSKLKAFLKDSVPVDPKKGNFIQSGVDKELDKLRKVIKKSKDWIAQAQETERERTGINSLKIKFNKVFGYYIEVSKSNLDQVPDEYDRKQTLVNSERFITPELKHHEEIILSNESKTQELELEIFQSLLDQITAMTTELQQTARAIATIDCLSSLAEVAQLHKYTKPKITANQTAKLSLKESRHPVVEQTLEDTQFVPNDVEFNTRQQLLVITGPNMAGKSVFMRQVALITLMAHIGSFVPAKEAKINLVDRVFVRSGAADVISEGLSTFMVEMVETATILNQASEQSLVIMDEIGRGTTTYDGISIAWAVAEYLVNEIGAKTLFATHYHELQALEDEHPNKIKNFHAAVELHQGEPVFIHRILKGKAESSYGINVAKLAGVPNEVAQQAQIMLNTLENTDNITVSPQHIKGKSERVTNQLTNQPINKSTKIPAGQLDLLEVHDSLPAYQIPDTKYKEIIKTLQNLNLGNTTPIEALNTLAKLQKELE